MGGAHSSAALGALPPLPPDVAEMPRHFLASLGDREGATIVQKRQGVFKAYIEACSACAGVVLTFDGARASSDADRAGEGPSSSSSEVHESRFVRAVCAAIPALWARFARKGQRRFVVDDIFFFVLIGPEVKLFEAHMRGLELVAFLSLRGVVVPPTAIAHFMGVSFACTALTHLHTLAPPECRHAAIVRTVLGSLLRLRNEPPLVMYCGGDGTLVVVDATALLPPLCMPGASGKYWHCARPELLLAHEAVATLAPHLSAGGVHPARDAAAVDNVVEKPVLSLVLDAAAGRRRHPGTPTLNALAALAPPGTVVLSGRVEPVAAPAMSTAAASYEFRHQHGFHANLPLTNALLQVAVPAAVAALEGLPESATPQDMMAGLKRSGIGAHMLGMLWHSVDIAAHARRLLAVEIVARAAKRWVERRVYAATATATASTAVGAPAPAPWQSHGHHPQQQSSDANTIESVEMNPVFVCEPFVLELFRGFSDDAFLERELHPFARAMFGPLLAPPLVQDLVFSLLFGRAQQLLGVAVASGRLQRVSPRVRTVRCGSSSGGGRFSLTAPDEAALFQVAARRDDGMAAAMVISAVSRWQGNAVRPLRLVEQIEARVRGTAAEASPLARGVLLLLKVDLYHMLVARGRWLEAVEVLSPELMAWYPHAVECPHDKLMSMVFAAPLADTLLARCRRPNAALEHVRLMLSLGGISDLSNVNVVAGRGLLECLHRVSFEACGATRQMDEAAIIAQRWHRVCPLLFGATSLAFCRATRMLLTCAVRRKDRAEALRLGHALLHLTAAAAGPESVAMAHALSDLASLVWKRDPAEGVRLYQRAHDLYAKGLGPISRGACTSLYNTGLALTRMNRTRAALGHFSRAKALALQLQEASTAAMCERSERTVAGIAATKLQRWYRERRYGQAKSQTTRTDATTTLCSTLTWSDAHDDGDISSSAGGFE